MTIFGFSCLSINASETPFLLSSMYGLIFCTKSIFNQLRRLKLNVLKTTCPTTQDFFSKIDSLIIFTITHVIKQDKKKTIRINKIFKYIK